MAIDFNASNVRADVRAYERHSGDGLPTRTDTDGTRRSVPVRNPSIDAEHAMTEASQRNRVQREAPAHQGIAAAVTRIGAQPAQEPQFPPQMLWNMNSVNSVTTAGREQGGLSDKQHRLHWHLVTQALGKPTGEGTPPQKKLTQDDLVGLLLASGLPPESIDGSQLNAALRFINEQDHVEKEYIGTQYDRVRKTLDSFHILSNIGHPQLERSHMLDLLWGAVTVPGHAFRKASDSDLVSSYQQIAAALNGPPGEHVVPLTRHNLEFTTNEAGEVTRTDTDRTHARGMQIASAVLTVASFIPPLTIPASIANAALSAYQGIKNGDWLQAVAGVAAGIAGAAGAIAGTAISGAATTTARIANGISKAAYGVRAGLQAYETGDVGALVNAGLQVASGVAGAVGKGAEGVARAAQNVQKWADRALVGEKVVLDLKNGRYLEAAAGGAALTSDVAGDFRQEDGSLTPKAQKVRDRAEQVGRYAAYANTGLTVSDQVRHGEYAAALANASTLTGAINAEFGGTPESRGGRAAEYLGYGAAAAQVAQNLEAGDYDAALAASQYLIKDIGDGPADDGGQPKWAQRAGEWIDYVGIGRAIEQGIRDGDYTSALVASRALANDIADGINDDQTPPQWLNRANEYVDYARAGLAIEQNIRDGDYDAALQVTHALISDIGNGQDDDRGQPKWAQRAGEYVDYVAAAHAIEQNLRDGNYGDALRASQALVNDIGNGPYDIRAPSPWAQKADRWLGYGATAADVVAQVKRGQDAADFPTQPQPGVPRNEAWTPMPPAPGMGEYYWINDPPPGPIAISPIERDGYRIDDPVVPAPDVERGPNDFPVGHRWARSQSGSGWQP